MDNPLADWTNGARRELRATVEALLQTFADFAANNQGRTVDHSATDHAMAEVAKLGRFRLGGHALAAGEAARLLDAIRATVREVPTVDAMIYTIAAFLENLTKPRERRTVPRFATFLMEDLFALGPSGVRPSIALVVQGRANMMALRPVDGMFAEVASDGSAYRYEAGNREPGEGVIVSESGAGRWVRIEIDRAPTVGTRRGYNLPELSRLAGS